MTPLPNRRHFLAASLSAAGLALATRAAPAASVSPEFSFVFLGDLHFDRPEHHDMAWVRAEKPNDIGQIENYCRVTREFTPRLLAAVRETIAELNAGAGPRVAFVLQAGDLVEGLCGNEELAIRHNTEAIAFLREAGLGVPFLFTKGNHDITGPGAAPAFARVFQPFLTAEARGLSPGLAPLDSARFTVDCGPAQFVFFDAYDAAASLDWFEAVAARRNAENLFVAVHPPVVPYGARATWHLFSGAKDRAKREKFLALLGDHRAVVLGGHIHKFNRLTRTAGRGRFTQFALSSVIGGPVTKEKTLLGGVATYDGDQIKVEPNFSPATEPERRAVYAAEREFVRSFDYADLPGYAVVTVKGSHVTARIYSGFSRQLWRTVDLSPA